LPVEPPDSDRISERYVGYDVLSASINIRSYGSERFEARVLSLCKLLHKLDGFQ
jgi:hypothetical protein